MLEVNTRRVKGGNINKALKPLKNCGVLAQQGPDPVGPRSARVPILACLNFVDAKLPRGKYCETPRRVIPMSLNELWNFRSFCTVQLLNSLRTVIPNLGKPVMVVLI